MPVKSKTYKFYRWPNPARGEFSRTYGGIVEVLKQYSRFLPVYGWMEVNTPEEADLVVGHLGIKTERLDVFHVHGLMPTADGESTKGDYATNALLVDNIRRAKQVICVSDWVADILRRDMHMSPEVLGHGFDWEVWKEVPAVVFNNHKRPKVLWNKTRNFGVCDPTPVIELARRVPKVDFLTTFLPRDVDARNVPSNVKVTGLLNRWEAWGLVKAVDAYLATTKETFGVGALEAMASQVPIVGFLHGATPEVVGEAGLFVEVGDYDGLAEAVQDALQRKAELGQMGLERMKDRFSWSSTIRRLAGIYEAVLLGSKPKSPRVTVIIPCYNKAEFVGQAIQSIREQSYKDWELLVVNDASTDGSLAAITEAIEGEKRARLIEHPENRGVAHARNTGITAGMGEYVCCLDADDSCAPSYLQALVDGMEKNPRLAVVYTGITILDASGNLRANTHTWPEPFDPSKGLKGNQIPTSCLFKRDWWRRVGGYRQRYAPHGAGQEDADFWVRILANGGGAEMVSKEGLFHYRLHANQVTRVHRDDWKKNLYMAWYPFVQDGQHPLASQLGVPEKGSWPVRDYDRSRVSVVVPVAPYHSAIFGDALDSVEAQTYRSWELIVVNDTGQPLDTTAWPYARVYDTGGAATGPGHARNVGTQHARAPLVVYLDADDVLQPEFLELTLLLWLEAKGWVYTDFFYTKDDGAQYTWQTKDWSAERLWDKGLAAVTGLYPVEAWKDVGGFDETIPHEDWDFHIKLAMAGYCGTRLAEPLITYRHDAGQRREKSIADKGFLKIKKRYSKEVVMGCGCGKGGGRHTSAPRRTRKVAAQKTEAARVPAPLPEAVKQGQPGAGYVLLGYVGKSDTDLLFKGREGRQYIFSTRRPWNWVHPLDVQRLVVKSVLQRYDPAQVRSTNESVLVVPGRV
jgi:teichuronic acid biosynthesis glycosyltransferase TuaG